MDLQALRAVASRLGIELAPAQIQALTAFVTDLYATNQTTNLTRVPEGEADAMHLADSLLVAEFAKRHARVLDIGAGPGFPAVPLALCRPDLDIIAVEATSKFATFLSAHCPTNVEVVNGRAEELDGRETVDLVTGRALAPLGIQLELSAAWCKVGGLVVPFRTPAEREACATINIGVLGLRLVALEERQIPGTDVVRLFPVYEKVRPTPAEYPRPWARIKARPFSARLPKPGSS
ncbi:MAG: 16S rRNA (guanine(527)-N(7))-methyltransferase RsmG [Armatimonadetes bacterium]|nr:16S rRNA (guanine(527)-N(7))-methyltransferase RsmG [Armatimonadota bacterium]